MARAPVSVCIITKDEEKHLPGCLASVSWADEIIVVDSHSTDRTCEIAEAAGARVIKRDFTGHIDQKNFALRQSSHEWALGMDADERLTPELTASIQAALENPGDYNGFKVNRRSRFFGKWIRHSGWYPNVKPRLCRHAKARWGGRDPHDSLRVDGKTKRLKGDLLHHPYDGFHEYVAKVNGYTTTGARVLFEEGRRCRFDDLVFRPFVTFLRIYFFRAGFLDGMAGYKLARLGAWTVFSKYAKLRELYRVARDEAAQP